MFFFWTVVGALLAALSIEVFFIPNRLIDGGIMGVAMIVSKVLGGQYLPYLLVGLNIPFLYLAWRYVGKTFVIHLIWAIFCFAVWLLLIDNFFYHPFRGETIEVVVIGGAILGVGLGLIIRMGGSVDGTEVLGIIVNKRTGITVGNVVLFCNIFIFAAAGFVFQDWHPPLLSLITYFVVVKVMDSVIVGLDETKSVLIVSPHSEQIGRAIMEEMGLSITIMYGRGGYSGEEKEIIYVICERLQLADLKALIYTVDKEAFVAIENIHEVANGNQAARMRSKLEKFSPLMRKKH